MTRYILIQFTGIVALLALATSFLFSASSLANSKYLPILNQRLPVIYIPVQDKAGEADSQAVLFRNLGVVR